MILCDSVAAEKTIHENIDVFVDIIIIVFIYFD